MLYLITKHGLNKRSIGQKVYGWTRECLKDCQGSEVEGWAGRRGLGMSGWGPWLSSEGKGEQLVNRGGERVGQKDPSRARARAQLSHQKKHDGWSAGEMARKERDVGGARG